MQPKTDFHRLENTSRSCTARGRSKRAGRPPERFGDLKEPKSAIRLFPHIGVIRELFDSIREGRPPKFGCAESRAAVKLCEACLLSARTNQVVQYPLKSRPQRS
jgi:hypothetical protein